jgi:hypothetical protein
MPLTAWPLSSRCFAPLPCLVPLLRLAQLLLRPACSVHCFPLNPPAMLSAEQFDSVINFRQQGVRSLFPTLLDPDLNDVLRQEKSLRNLFTRTCTNETQPLHYVCAFLSSRASLVLWPSSPFSASWLPGVEAGSIIAPFVLLAFFLLAPLFLPIYT